MLKRQKEVEDIMSQNSRTSKDEEFEKRKREQKQKNDVILQRIRDIEQQNSKIAELKKIKEEKFRAKGPPEEDN